jgi:hypothetical protein
MSFGYPHIAIGSVAREMTQGRTRHGYKPCVRRSVVKIVDNHVSLIVVVVVDVYRIARSMTTTAAIVLMGIKDNESCYDERNIDVDLILIIRRTFVVGVIRIKAVPMVVSVVSVAAVVAVIVHHEWLAIVRLAFFLLIRVALVIDIVAVADVITIVSSRNVAVSGVVDAAVVVVALRIVVERTNGIGDGILIYRIELAGVVFPAVIVVTESVDKIAILSASNHVQISVQFLRNIDSRRR